MVGILLLVAGASMRLLRIKRNWIIGYRTPASMKDEESWAFANKLAGTYMIVIGLISTICGLVNHYVGLISYHIVIIVTAGMIVVAIVPIEISLKRRATRAKIER